MSNLFPAVNEGWGHLWEYDNGLGSLSLSILFLEEDRKLLRSVKDLLVCDFQV